VKIVKYECLYIIQAAVEDEQRNELIERFNSLITSNGGEVEKVDEWGKRRLAYPIDYQNEGYYVLLRFTANSDFPRELERNFQITEQVIRYLVTRVDA
jgi:small subunit ribosomal protein S6